MTREEAIERVRSRFNKWALDDEDLTALQMLDLVDTDSEDERIRKEIISALKFANDGGVYDKHIAYLEKQKENIEKEYVFRPLAGTDINSAVLQAIRRADEGDRLVLAFNGVYIPVRKGCNANKIVDIYDAFIEKQKEQKPTEKSINWTELTWEDINELEDIINKVHYEFRNGIGAESFGKEVLEQFREYKGDEYLDEIEQKPVEWSEDFEDNIRNLLHDKLAGHSEDGSMSWATLIDDKTLKDIVNGIWFYVGKEALKYSNKELSEPEWNKDWREEDIQTRFAFYTYKDNPSELYLSNVFVEEASRNHGLGTRILRAAEKVAETIGATTICLKVKTDSPANAWYRKNGYGYVCYDDGYDWLEKNLEYLKPKKEVEWSEEDEKKINSIIFKLQHDGGLMYEKEITFLKSLRPSWKPSEEQMNALEWATNWYSDTKQCDPVLYSLLSDLKKL